MDEGIDARRAQEGVLFLIGFALCIPAANWLIANAGTVACRTAPA